VYDWLLTDQRNTVIERIEAGYVATENYDFEYAFRLPGSDSLEWGTADIISGLDKIANFSIANDLTLFSDLQIVTLEKARSGGLTIEAK
jgi:hypothetical protein